MERRQLPAAADGTWDRPRYGGGGSAQHPPGLRPEAPRHGEALPRALYPGGPWESRLPYEGSEQRALRDRPDYTQLEHREPPQHGGPQCIHQFRPLRPGGFPHGGTRPGMPLHGPMDQMGSQPRLPHMQPAEVYGSDGLQAPMIPTDGSFPQHRALQPLQGLMPYNAPRHGTPEARFQGRPQQMIPAMVHQDVGRRHNTIYQPGEQPPVQRHDTMFQPGEQPPVQRHDTMFQPGEQPPVQRHDTIYQPGEQPPVQRHDTIYQPGEQPPVQRHNTIYQPGEQPPVQRHNTIYQPGEQPPVQRHDTMYQPGEQLPVQRHDTMYRPGEQPPEQHHNTIFQPGEQLPVQRHDKIYQPGEQRHNTMFQPGERPANLQLHDTMYQPGEPPPVQRHDTIYQPGEHLPVKRHDTLYQPGEHPPLQRHDSLYQPGERPANVQRHDAKYQPGEPPPVQRHDTIYQPGEHPPVKRHDTLYQLGERQANVQRHDAKYQPGEQPPNVQRHETMYQAGERPTNVQRYNAMYQPGEQPPNVQHHDPMYQSEEQHPNVQCHEGPQNTSDEHQDPMFSGRPQPRSEQPAVFHQGGPKYFRGLDPALPQYSERQPDGFQHDSRGNLHLPYQNKGSQAGLRNLNSPPVPDTFSYRAPSPDIQQFSTQLQSAPTQNSPYTDNPQQGHYHLPPMHGRQPNPSNNFHPLEGSAFSRSFEERDLEDPRFQRPLGHPQQSVMHQDIRQGPDPPVLSGLAGDRYFKHDAPLPQHQVTDGRGDPHLLPQHGGPFAPQSIPNSEDSFMHLDRQTKIENDWPSDKDFFMHWLFGFLSCRRKNLSIKPVADQSCSVADARGLIYGALQLVSQLDSLCQALESSNKAGEPWAHDYEKAAGIRVDLEKRLKELEKPGYIQSVKMKLDRVRKKRLRCQRRKQAIEEEEKAAAERCAEKEASIDLWRMQCIQKVEEKKRERELKATADSVLGEVRKKQNDVKKMLDVLKALEKLRKLRKEAAGRKGVHPPPSADETFANHIKRLRTMVHKRSALYDAEEKTLRVILEGEQEEERQREKDKSQRKEKEKILQKQRELDSILFGDIEPLPGLHPLMPFRQYYLQAEHSVVSLVKIRHEWDQFLVPPDHPDGSSIPRGWVVPTIPSNDTWASAVKPSD